MNQRSHKARDKPRHETSRGDRLQKVMAAAGIGSRRDCEQLIQAGRVEVDGDVVTELGTRVILGQQEVRVDGQPLASPKPKYYLVNKPPGIVSTNRDQDGRLRVIDLVPPEGHLFTVGRLDRSSEGLMLVTNDGELANRLAHPRYGISKTYRVTVAGHPTPEALKQLRQGVWLADGPVRVAALSVKKRQRKNTILEMVLTEGRNREIRRMAAKIGHKVLELKRVALGPLTLGDIPPGAYRELTRGELNALRAAGKGKGVPGRAGRSSKMKACAAGPSQQQAERQTGRNTDERGKVDQVKSPQRSKTSQRSKSTQRLKSTQRSKSTHGSKGRRTKSKRPRAVKR